MNLRRSAFWVAAAAAFVALFVAGRLLPFREWLAVFERWIADLGPEAYVIYVAGYVLVAVLMMPAILMILGAGFVFGLVRGAAVVWIGATLGAAASFLIARHVARDRVARWVASNPRYAAIDRAIGATGWRIVFLLRLSPLVPYVASNYFYGLTAIPFWPYVFASAAGMLPLTFLYVSLGVAAHEAVGPSGMPGAAKWGLLALGVVMAAAASLYAQRIVKRALEEEA